MEKTQNFPFIQEGPEGIFLNSDFDLLDQEYNGHF